MSGACLWLLIYIIVKSFSRLSLLCAALLPLTFACVKDTEEESYPGMKTVTYQATDANIANPERGFYAACEIYSASPNGD